MAVVKPNPAHEILKTEIRHYRELARDQRGKSAKLLQDATDLDHNAEVNDTIADELLALLPEGARK